MFTNYRKKIKIKDLSEGKKRLIPNLSQNKYKIKYYSSDLPPINQNDNIIKKIKKSSLSKSITFLYQSLFPDEKNTMQEFLDNYSYEKFFNRPIWKYTFYRYKIEDQIKYYAMLKNNEMKLYNKMKKPCKLKKEFKRKPRMVQIIEDNTLYKNRIKNNPWDENYIFLNKNNSVNILSKSKENKEEYNDYNENNYSKNIFENINGEYKNRNRINLNNIYKDNISSLKKNKMHLSYNSRNKL